MSEARTQPPTGKAPSTADVAGGSTLELEPLAREVCRRYSGEFPDEDERYGPAGRAWCVHDNQYLLSWAADSVRGYVDLHQQVAWLASVLEARAFPIARLARNLELGAAVVRERLADEASAALSEALDNAAAFVRSRSTFLDLEAYELAAAAGDTAAAFDLGVLLTKMNPPDLVGARRWWEQAAAAGHDGAATSLAALREELSPADPSADDRPEAHSAPGNQSSRRPNLPRRRGR